MENIKGKCYMCDSEISVVDNICKHCLKDLEKEALQDDYLESFNYDNE